MSEPNNPTEHSSLPERSELQVQALIVKHLWDRSHFLGDLDFKVNLETLLQMIAEGRS